MKNMYKSNVAAVLISAFASGGVMSATLEEVIVTAQKREQNLQDVPVSVTAMSGETLNRLGLTSSQDLMKHTPGLQWGSFGGGATVSLFSLRGVSQVSFEDHQEAPVAFYRDGSYISFMSAVGNQMFDIERAEVLKGPQGTLFGRNSTGGVIHLTSKKPTKEFEGYFRGTFGSYDQVYLDGAVSGTLIEDQLLGRLAVSKREADGYWENRIGLDKNTEDNYSVRAHLEFIGLEDVNALLSFNGSRDRADGFGGMLTARAMINDDGLGFAPPNQAAYNEFCEGFFLIPSVPDQDTCFGYVKENDDPFSGAANTEGFLDRDHYGASLNLDWSLSEQLRLVSVTDWQTFEKDYLGDADATPVLAVDYFTSQENTQFTQEFRLEGDSDVMNWLVGAYYLYIDGDYLGGVDTAELYAGRTENLYELKTESYSVFGQIEYRLSSQLSLIAGLRWTQDNKDFDFTGVCFGATCDPELFFFSAPGTIQADGFSGDQDENDYEFKAQLSWSVTDDTLLFAGVSRGYKAGGFNAPVVATIPPEETAFDGEALTSYEAGFKSTLFGGRARLNGSVFYYDYQDFQAFQFSNLTSLIVNADAEIYGGELELQATPAPGLDILLGVSVLDTTVEDIVLPSGRAADREAPFSPDISLNALIRKEWVLSETVLSVQADLSYVDEQQFSTLNAPITLGDSYTVVGARLSISDRAEKWVLSGFVDNATDEVYTINGFDNSGLIGTTRATLGEPRWYGVQLEYNWN
ncbi:TonB-dependent receptor [Pseudohaliea sp.]|uniref:TonB-dependent receptor n=1 Tax=Pseudohaliea sp. TaxID=2740289 RepID=UPI0032EB4D8C